MPSNEEVIGSPNAKHLNPYQSPRNDNCMDAINADRVHALQPSQWVAPLVRKARISTQISHGSARFNPTKDVPFRGVLVLYRDRGLAVNAGTAKGAQNDSWESQPLPSQQLATIKVMVLSVFLQTARHPALLIETGRPSAELP
jgi:hypothetical protein